MASASIPMPSTGIPVPPIQEFIPSSTASAAEVWEDEAGPSGAQAGPTHSTFEAGTGSSSVFLSPQYWMSDRIPVLSEHASTYVLPERDPTLFAPYPTGAGPVSSVFTLIVIPLLKRVV